MNYQEFKRKQEKEFEKFAIFFAFNENQITDGLEKLNICKKDAVSVGGGGFIRKQDVKAFDKLLNKLVSDKETAFKSKVFLTDAILYELGNHEFSITGDPAETIYSLGIDLKNEFQKSCFVDAINKFNLTAACH